MPQLISIICWSETNAHVLFAYLHCNWTCLYSSLVHSAGMSNKSCCNVVQISCKNDVGVPETLCEDTGSVPYFLLVGALVTEFSPHTNFTSNDVDPCKLWFKFVDVSPFDVSQVGASIPWSKTNIKIGLIIVGENNFIGSVDQIFQIFGLSPPLNYIIVFDW